MTWLFVINTYWHSVGFCLCVGLLLLGFLAFGAAFCSGSMLLIGFIAVLACCYFVWPVAAGFGSFFGGGWFCVWVGLSWILVSCVSGGPWYGCSVVSGEALAVLLLACRNVLCSTSHLSVSSHLFYTSVQLKTRVFWDMAVCRWVCVSRRFEGK